MESSAEEYAAFEEKVKRTVYLDNLSPQVTESVIRTALDQFALVKSVKFIPNYLGTNSLPQCALVELESAKKVKEVIAMIKQYPFMMSGMPRPIRARPSLMEMFDDRPIKPKRKIKCCWLEQSDPDFEVAKELKNLTRKHSAEITLMHKVEKELKNLMCKHSALMVEALCQSRLQKIMVLSKEEEKLATQQAETLKVHYKKYRMIESIMTDRAAHTLARKYNLTVADD